MAPSALDYEHVREGERCGLCFILGLVDSEGGYDDHECHSNCVWEEFSGRSDWTLYGREHTDGPKDKAIGIHVEELERVVEAGLHARPEMN